jgi:hypothetical protein
MFVSAYCRCTRQQNVIFLELKADGRVERNRKVEGRVENKNRINNNNVDE